MKSKGPEGMKKAIELKYRAGEDFSGGGKAGTQNPDQEGRCKGNPNGQNEISRKKGQLFSPVHLAPKHVFFVPFSHFSLHSVDMSDKYLSCATFLTH